MVAEPITNAWACDRVRAVEMEYEQYVTHLLDESPGCLETVLTGAGPRALHAQAGSLGPAASLASPFDEPWVDACSGSVFE